MTPEVAGPNDFSGSSLGASFTPKKDAISEKVESYTSRMPSPAEAAAQQLSKCWHTMSGEMPDSLITIKSTILARRSNKPALLTQPKSIVL